MASQPALRRMKPSAIASPPQRARRSAVVVMPPKLVASAEKAIRELGWKPQFPKLEDIVATAWAWHKKHPDGYAD